MTSAQSAYVTGKTPFLSLIEAERNLVGLRDRYYETLADYFRRLAAWSGRSAGRSPRRRPRQASNTPPGRDCGSIWCR